MNQDLNDLLTRYSNKQQISAGETIFNYQESADKIYIILQGLVRLFTRNRTGDEEEIARLESGSILGELALLEADNNYSSRATAYKDTTLLAFPPQDLKKLIYQEPTLTERVIHSLCNRIQLLKKPVVKLPEISKLLAAKEPMEPKTPTEEVLSKQVVEEKKTKNNEQQIVKPSQLYLDGHGDYPQAAEEKFDHYLYTKTITCPVCSAEIEVKKVRNSRLHLQEIRDDLRPLYKEFKPSWYKIWICPQCLFTARTKDFFKFRKKTRNQIKDNFLDKVHSDFGFNYQPSYSNPRTLNQVFTAYYLAIFLYDFIAANKDKQAYLWLWLNWLYEDVEEEALAEEASQQAMELLSDFYFNNNDFYRLSRPQKDKRTLLLALLFYKHDRKDEALPLLDDLVRSPQTNRRHKQLARDKFIEIRREE